MYSYINNIYIHIYLESNIPLPLNISMSTPTVYPGDILCEHIPKYMYTCANMYVYTLHLCVHKSFKGTIYKGASFLENCGRVKTECHNCKESQKEI